MLYNSTQNSSEVVSAAQAIAQGISKDGGLFVPQEFPKFDTETFKALLNEDYKGRAKKVFSAFLTDFTKEEIRVIIGEVLAKTYSDVNVSDLREEIDLAVDFNKLTFEFVELCGNWQTVNGEHYFVHDETKTLNKLSKYRKQVP